MERENELRAAVDAALAAGASYAEARYGREEKVTVAVVDGAPGPVRRESTSGLSVRVLVDGGWGFAAAPDTGSGSPSPVERALELARASARARRPVALAPAEPVTGEHVTPRGDQATLLADALAVLVEAHGLMAVPGIVRREGNLELRTEVMELVTSEGSRVAQELGIIGGGIAAVAGDNGARAQRSYPHHGGWGYANAGLEWFEAIDLLGQATRVAEEAVLLLTARPCPHRVTTVVLDPSLVGTLLHETVGHATELDRALGEELDNFGSTFARPEMIGAYPYASPAVSVTADATFPGAAGTYGFDAEGQPAQRVPLIEDGVLVELASSRECAAEIGRASTGSARASSWNRVPMARITNLVLEPGADTLDSLIAGVDDGVYIQTDSATDIDDNRELCAFSGELGWLIRNGRLVEPVAGPIVYGDTHTLLRQVDGVGGAHELVLTGIAGCGKGQPWQFVTTGQGGPPARIRNVEVGFAA